MKTIETFSETVRISDEEKNFVEEYFFDFNNIDYYFTDPQDNHLYDLYEKGMDSLTAMDHFYIKVVNKRKDTSLTFVDSLEMIGFTKTKIVDSKIDQIHELFKSKYVDIIETTACDPVYRDILVFKKDSSIVGVAKICFSCDQKVIYGSSVPSASFGQHGEIFALKDILNE